MINLIECWLSWKLSDHRIKKRLDISKPQHINLKDKEKIVRAAAVQRKTNPVKSIEAYVDIMESSVMKAALERCDIIVFPEYNFFDLLGVFPGFAAIDQYLNKKAAGKAGAKGKPEEGIEKLYPMLLNIAEPVGNAIEKLMCGLASNYHMYIYTGSYFIREGNQLYNGGALISREGKLLARQKKLHLTDFEEKLGIKRDNEFKAIALDIGKVAFPVCMDATYFETFSLARAHSCDIVLLPIANNEEYGTYRALRGIWPRVQESHIYGVKAALTGWICGLHFTGKAGVFAPVGITPQRDGVVSISKDCEGNSLAIGEIDLEALYKERDEDEYYGDSNPQFEKNYIENTY